LKEKRLTVTVRDSLELFPVKKRHTESKYQEDGTCIEIQPVA